MHLISQSYPINKLWSSKAMCNQKVKSGKDSFNAWQHGRCQDDAKMVDWLLLEPRKFIGNWLSSLVYCWRYIKYSLRIIIPKYPKYDKYGRDMLKVENWVETNSQFKPLKRNAESLWLPKSIAKRSLNISMTCWQQEPSPQLSAVTSKMWWESTRSSCPASEKHLGCEASLMLLLDICWYLGIVSKMSFPVIYWQGYDMFANDCSYYDTDAKWVQPRNSVEANRGNPLRGEALPGNQTWQWKSTMHDLVGGIPTPLKNMKVSWDDEIPKIWENKKCLKPPTRWL